jgi:hypothetical protein
MVSVGLCTKKMPDLFCVGNQYVELLAGWRVHDFDTASVRFLRGTGQDWSGRVWRYGRRSFGQLVGGGLLDQFDAGGGKVDFPFLV